MLRKNAYNSIHCDKGSLVRRIQANFTFSKSLLDGVDAYCGYTELEPCDEFYAYRFVPLLDLQYPGFYFVNNTRDVSRWLDSRMNHLHGKYVRASLDWMSRANDDPSWSMEDLRQRWQ